MTKDDLELAERHDQLQAAAKAKAVEIRELDEQHRAAVKKHHERIAAERTTLHHLQTEAARAGSAKNAILQSVPEDVRDALGAAERAERAVAVRLKDVRLTLTLAREERERQKKAGADAPALKSADRSIVSAEAAVAEVAAEEKKVRERVDAARRAFAEALEKVKRTVRVDRAAVPAR